MIFPMTGSVRSTFTTRGYERELDAWNAAFTRDEINPKLDTIKFAVPILERQLDAALAQIERTETKAALIIPAIGVIVGIVAPLIRADAFQLPGLTPSFLIVAILAAIFCPIFAVVSLLPRVRSNGPDPSQVLKGSAEPVGEAHWDYLKSLGFAVATATAVAVDKANWLISSFIAAAISIVLLVVFYWSGGFVPATLATN